MQLLFFEKMIKWQSGRNLKNMDQGIKVIR